MKPEPVPSNGASVSPEGMLLGPVFEFHTTELLVRLQTKYIFNNSYRHATVRIGGDGSREN